MEKNLIKTQDTANGVAGFPAFKADSKNSGTATAYIVIRPEQSEQFKFSTPDNIQIYDFGSGLVFGVVR